MVIINLCCHFLSEVEITGLGKGLCDTDERKRGLKKEASDMYTLLYLKWITSKDLLYSTGNSAQCYVAAWMGEGFGGEWIHVYVWLSPFAVHLKLSQHSVHIVNWLSVQFSSFQFSHLVMSNSAITGTATHQVSFSITNSWSLLKPMSIESVMPSNYLILRHPLLLLSSISPSIRVFSNESALCIR